MTAGASRLDSSTIVLHWLVAAGLVAMLTLGTILSRTPSGPDKTALIQFHKSLGIVVLAVALVRVARRWRDGHLPPVGRPPRWEMRLARAVQSALLALSMLMPLAGIATSITYARPVRLFGLPFAPQLLASNVVQHGDHQRLRFGRRHQVGSGSPAACRNAFGRQFSGQSAICSRDRRAKRGLRFQAAVSSSGERCSGRARARARTEPARHQTTRRALT